MKKITTITSFVILVCLPLFQYATAQTKTALASRAEKEMPTPANNIGYLLNPAATSPASTPIPAAYVSEKVLKTFGKKFKQADNPIWYHLDKRTFLVKFHSGNRKAQAAFTRNGYMNYAVHYGTESSLPKEDRRRLKSNYVDYTIGVVFEATVDNKTIWIVNLEDPETFIVARIADGALEEIVHSQKHVPVKKQRKGKVIIPQ